MLISSSVKKLLDSRMGRAAARARLGTLLTQVGGVTTRNNLWFVDPSVSASGDGTSWDAAFKTMDEAFAALAAGDTIFFYASSSHNAGALTLSVNGVSLIGFDSNPSGNRLTGAAGETILTVTGDNCLIEGIRFGVPAYSTGGGVGIELSGANGLVIRNCVFHGGTGAYYGINSDGSSDNVRIEDCEFRYFNTATHGTALRGHTYTADVTHSTWDIIRCKFHSNLKHVAIRLRQSRVIDCLFQEKGLDASGETALTATTKLDLSGTLSKWNTVTRNTMQGDYSNTGGYTAGTEDNWFGNIADDTAEAEVYDDGTTTAVPAA